MIFRFLLLVALIAWPVSVWPPADCEKGCTTTVVVQDCDGDPVANAKVQIKVCCTGGSDMESTTDSNGEASFPYCTKDICDSRVILTGFAESSFDARGCKTSGKTSRCTVKMCKR